LRRLRRPPRSPRFPYTTLFRSKGIWSGTAASMGSIFSQSWEQVKKAFTSGGQVFSGLESGISSQFKTVVNGLIDGINAVVSTPLDRKSTRLNSSHVSISYAVFC